MTYTLDELADIIEKLKSKGFRGVVIGSTVIDLELRRKTLEDDVDFFAYQPSPLVEEDAYRSIASKYGWELTYTELGTPRIIARTKKGEIILEFYENIHDFYIPPEMLERAPTKKLRGVDVQILRLEDYIVLKAKAGRDKDMEDLEEISYLIKQGKLKIDERVIKDALNMLPEEDKPLTAKRLKKLGFRV